MWGRLGPRFAVEALFLILVAVGLGIADVLPLVIVVVMAGAWLLVSLIELIASRQPTFPPLAAPVEAAPAVTPAVEPAPAPQVGADTELGISLGAEDVAAAPAVQEVLAEPADEEVIAEEAAQEMLDEPAGEEVLAEPADEEEVAEELPEGPPVPVEEPRRFRLWPTLRRPDRPAGADQSGVPGQAAPEESELAGAEVVAPAEPAEQAAEEIEGEPPAAEEMGAPSEPAGELRRGRLWSRRRRAEAGAVEAPAEAVQPDAGGEDRPEEPTRPGDPDEPGEPAPVPAASDGER